jgi:hypothetical protein
MCPAQCPVAGSCGDASRPQPPRSPHPHVLLYSPIAGQACRRAFGVRAGSARRMPRLTLADLARDQAAVGRKEPPARHRQRSRTPPRRSRADRVGARLSRAPRLASSAPPATVRPPAGGAACLYIGAADAERPHLPRCECSELPETWAPSSRLIASRLPVRVPRCGAASRQLSGGVVAGVRPGRAKRGAVVRRHCLILYGAGNQPR